MFLSVKNRVVMWTSFENAKYACDKFIALKQLITFCDLRCSVIWLMVAGHSSPASLILTVQTGCRTAATGGMTEQPHMALFTVILTTMI